MTFRKKKFPPSIVREQFGFLLRDQPSIFFYPFVFSASAAVDSVAASAPGRNTLLSPARSIRCPLGECVTMRD
ncbi:MAG: hypothetical protein A3H28_13990 [Acidobacteria bacterium RIFCSPLOWO2_02_FULL_61_28]|nr:MAG: hypothetical protein A3H28_13990 [Acidobacteria bacterium RIFCSPLOWO2_02_FULL_61_28]